MEFIPEIFKKEYKKEIPVKDLFTTIYKKTDEKLRLVGASDQGACACLALIRKEGPSMIIFERITLCYPRLFLSVFKSIVFF